MYSVDFTALVELASGREAVPADAMSANPPRSLPFNNALDLAEFQSVHEIVTGMSDDGVVVWDKFDIAPFAALMPSIATLDQFKTDAGEDDYIYRFVGQNLETIAKRSLRKTSLREVLHGKNRDAILQEYGATLTGRVPRASTGNVDISDLVWVRYLRFLYPVRTKTGVDRLLLFMLFAAP
jgi:hypothetical protein